MTRRVEAGTLGEAVELFLRLEVGGLAEETGRWYRGRLGRMVDFLGEGRGPGEVGELDLLDWVADLEERETRWGAGASRPEAAGGLAVESVLGYVRAARRFWGWMAKVRLVEVNPAEDVRGPRRGKLARRGVSDADQEAIIEAARGDARDYAILTLLAETGCRLGGLAGLRLGDVQPGDEDARLRRRVYVVEKGDKGRVVFVSERGRGALARWLDVRPGGCGHDFVFVRRDYGHEGERLGVSGIYLMVRRYAEATGVLGSGRLWSPHQWRHRFGRRWLENGGSLGVLSQVMGHSSVQVTVEFYGQLEVDALQRGYDDVMGA